MIIGDKWGYINEKNEMVIECQYDYIGLFQDGVARVGKDGNHFLIDQNGNLVEDNLLF